MSTPPRQLRRSGAVLAVLAPLLALWLGLTAPDTSPVQPPPAVQQAADPAATADQDPFTADFFHRLVARLPRREVYPCGPPAMATAARPALRDAGLPTVQLHEERFIPEPRGEPRGRVTRGAPLMEVWC